MKKEPLKKLSLIIFCLAIVILICFFVVFNFIVTPRKYKNYIIEFAGQYSIEPALVYAIIRVESNFDKNATSSAGAMGLMQIIPSTAKWIAEELRLDYSSLNMYNPETNIQFGCFYLNYLFERFDNMGAVICAYNAGETVVKSWLDESGNIDESKISYPETKNYYKRVLSYYNIYIEDEIGE